MAVRRHPARSNHNPACHRRRSVFQWAVANMATKKDAGDGSHSAPPPAPNQATRQFLRKHYPMPKVLGIDSSTQSLSAVILDTGYGNVAHEQTVNFGKDLPHFRCPSGYLTEGKNGEVHAEPLMWVEAPRSPLPASRRSRSAP